MINEKLKELRNSIDSIDNELLRLLNERMEIVGQVGLLKQSNNAIIYRPEREKAIVDRLERLAENSPLNRAMIEAIFLEIFAASRQFELPERIGYLGPPGSFTHQAAESRFGVMSEYVSLNSIRSVFENTATERIRFGVVPIENNQAGVVGETIDLFREMDVKIAAEILSPIHYTFASRLDKISDIKYIYSKDIAFQQCHKFVQEYFPEATANLIPVESTSKAAQMAMENEAGAAICSDVAAKLYKVPILFENIEDTPNNKTRFLIISKEFINQHSGQDKTTLIARLPDKPGSLAEFLQDFNTFQINITKIESRPERDQDKFNSWFFIELDGHYQDEGIEYVLEKHKHHVRWLGSYVKIK